MKVAVVTRSRDPYSLTVYRENVVRELGSLGVHALPFEEHDPVPDLGNIVWDPGLGMRKVPALFKSCPKPVVATIHGLRAFTLPWHEWAHSWTDRARLWKTKLQVSQSWRWFRRRVASVITVSQYGLTEAMEALSLPEDLLHSIHHGIAHDVFRPRGERPKLGENYLLVVAQSQPVKNLQRVFAAYTRLPAKTRPRLVAIVPGYPRRIRPPDGVQLMREGLAPQELATWYRGALAFALPSLRETFCMPILEAMACSCPVLTSNVTGCAEVAADAALLVDPRSISEIEAAMSRLITDHQLRTELGERGRERAKNFSWRKSAEEHLKVFEKARREIVQPSSLVSIPK